MGTNSDSQNSSKIKAGFNGQPVFMPYLGVLLHHVQTYIFKIISNCKIFKGILSKINMILYHYWKINFEV